VAAANGDVLKQPITPQLIQLLITYDERGWKAENTAANRTSLSTMPQRELFARSHPTGAWFTLSQAVIYTFHSLN
jgi:hypothetical protein